jgi:hypothetical protein
LSQRISKGIELSILFLIICFLIGCGAGKTLVMEPPTSKKSVRSVEIVQGKCTVEVPEEVVKTLETKLSELLYKEGGYTNGPELTITYRFLQCNPGSQLSRWFWGGIGNAGQGSLTVEATYTDPSNKQLCKIQCEGVISSGAFGGDFSFAVEKAANEIAEYTKKNFPK